MAGENPDFVSWCHELPCAARDLSPCDGGITAHHAGPRGYGQRAHDETCVPLCAGHHTAWHDLRYPFKYTTKAERAAWRDRAIEETHAAWRRRGGGDVPY